MIKKRLLALLSHSRKYIVHQVLWQWAGLFIQVILVGCIAQLIGAAFSGSLSRPYALPRLILAAAMIALRFLADREASLASYRASADVKRVLRKKLSEKLLRLGPSYREKITSSEVVQLAVEGVEQLETYFGSFIPQFFYAFLAPVTLFIVLSPVDRGAALALLICVPLMPMIIMAVQIIAKRLLAGYWGVYAELGDSFLENLQGLTTLKIYQADGAKAAEMDEESEKFRKITMKVLTMQLNSTAVMDIVAYGGAAIGMVKVLSDYFAGRVDLQGCIMVILLAAEFFLPMRILGSYFHIAMNGMAASDRIFALFDLPEEEEGSARLQEGPVPVSLSEVRYAYPVRESLGKKKKKRGKSSGEAAGTEKRGEEVLHGIDLELPVGITAVVGPSGCGKSTIAGIISGRNKGYGGSVLLGDAQLRDLREKELSDTVTLVGSGAYLFKGSVRENLRMGREDASDEALWEALEEVNLKSFFEEGEGLDTPIAEGASNLSGGQRQRLAIARALLHDSRVYVFDEATSNIDPESEEMILSVIHRIALTRTVLMITHRLRNAVRADRIYYMEHGRVLEEGTHEELLAGNGGYAALFRAQRALEEVHGEEEVRRETISLTKTQPSGKKEAASGREAGGAAGKRRSGIAIMRELIRLVRPLLPVMAAAITLGVIGYLCAIFLTVRAVSVLPLAQSPGKGFFAFLIIMAVLRGAFHCGEQYANHYIAFRLLALIRHEVFAALRRLCPARLETKEKGNLLSLITSDIELLEVFYAHTISPIAIGALVSLIMVLYIGSRSPLAGGLALIAYVAVGVFLPLWNSGRGREDGMVFRERYGELGGFVLRFLYGLDELIQFGAGPAMVDAIDERSRELGGLQEKLAKKEALQRAVTSLLIQLFSWCMLLMALVLFGQGRMGQREVLTAVAAMMGSFGPVVALASLSNNLNHTLASGERVLSLLEEEPAVAEREGKTALSGSGAGLEEVTFSYGAAEENILEDCSLTVEPGKITGIYGPSGAGKSTILKLLMRFWDPRKGCVRVAGTDVKEIGTNSLRSLEGYVTQETWLFHDTVAKNIEIGRLGAPREEIEAAAKKASVHDFIMSLPKGYDTPVGELGDTLSDGEKQRIGVARAFLHDGRLLLLDEPTSNLDALNEGIILQSLMKEAGEKTVVLVSHREQAMKIADRVLQADGTRAS